MKTLISETEQAMTVVDIAEAQKGGAAGGLTEFFRDAGILSRRLNVIVLNEYDDDAQKLAAWAIASHLEAVAVGGKTDPPAPQS